MRLLTRTRPRSQPTRVSGEATGAGWRGSRRLLSGPLRTLVAGQALGQGADGLAQITFVQVVLFEAGRGASPWELTKLLAVSLLPFCLVGPFAGVVIDRWDRRRTLVVVSAFRAALALAAIGVVILRSQLLAYADVLVLLSSSRFVLAAKGASLPRTVSASSLVTANAISSVAGLAASFLGAVGGSVFVARLPVVGFIGAATLYVAAAARFAALLALGGGEAVPLLAGLRRVATELADGLRAVTLAPAVRRPLLAVWAHRFLLGAGFILLVLVADHRYRLQAPGYGLALAVTGVASFAGTLAAPVLARRYSPIALLPGAFLTAAIAAVLGAFRPALAVLIAGVGLAGFAFQVLKVLVDALVQSAAPDEVRGRVFAVYDILYNIAFVLAGLALVPLWRPGHERVLLGLLALAFVVAGGLLARTLRVWPFVGPGEGRAPGPPWTRPPGPGEGQASGRPTAGETSVQLQDRWRGRVAGVGAGALPALAFPEPSLWWLAPVGLTPLLLLCTAARTPREATIRAWLGGVGFMLAVHWWLIPNVGPFVLPLALVFGALLVPFGPLAWSLLAPPLDPWRLGVAVAVLPSAWIVAELARSWQALGGPWGLLGTSQWGHPAMLALAAVGGVWLVSFVLVGANVALAGAFLSHARAGVRLSAVVLAVLLMAASPIYHAVRRAPVARRDLRLAGVQPGVIRGAVQRFEVGESMTLQVGGWRPELVVWGESSVGFDPERRPQYLDRLIATARATGADMLVNVDARRGSGGIYKSTLLVGPNGIHGRYDKMRLVPFGEYIPLRRAMGWVAGVTEAAKEDRRRGRSQVLLRTAGVALGPLVCFESAFPDLSRHLASMGADLLVVQSATSTFQGSWAPEQHASLAAVRAVETGRPVVHATLTGVSAAFDAEGRRLAWVSTDARGSYRVSVPLAHASAPYVGLGDWIPAASLVVLLVAALARGLRSARRVSQPALDPASGSAAVPACGTGAEGVGAQLGGDARAARRPLGRCRDCGYFRPRRGLLA